MLKHDAAVGVEPESTVHPVEQRRADLVLQPCQCARQRGLGDVEFGGGIGHVLGFGQRDKPMQLVQVHANIIRATY